MEQRPQPASRSSERRWAGAFRVCAACGGRNWVGARRCRNCSALLVAARAVARPPVAMVGRRNADRVLTPRVRAAAAAAAGVAILAAALLAHLLRADGFGEAPLVAATTPGQAVPAPPPAAAEREGPRPDVAAALRAAGRGRELLQAGHVKAALSVLGPAALVRADDADLAHLLAEALWRFGARDRALFQYERAVNLSPATDAFREDLARALRAMGRHARAARVMYGPSGPPPAPGAAGPAPPVSLEAGVDLGGAGSGSHAGRRSFTDEDLRRRVHARSGGEAPR